jgi:hypothetical protein
LGRWPEGHLYSGTAKGKGKGINQSKSKRKGKAIGMEFSAVTADYTIKAPMG